MIAEGVLRLTAGRECEVVSICMIPGDEPVAQGVRSPRFEMFLDMSVKTYLYFFDKARSNLGGYYISLMLSVRLRVV